MGQSAHSQVLHGNNIWRGSGSARATLVTREDGSQGLVVVRNQDTNGKGSDDKEEAKSPVDGLESVLDVDAWALGLGSDHGDVLWTDDGEGGGPHTSQEALKSAERARAEILSESARGVPVAKAVTEKKSAPRINAEL